MRSGAAQHLVDRQVDAGVGDDAQRVGQVAPVEGPDPLRLQDLSGTVSHARVLTRLPEGREIMLRQMKCHYESLESKTASYVRGGRGRGLCCLLVYTRVFSRPDHKKGRARPMGSLVVKLTSKG
ncbi:hypothetical protein EYF80_062763 [Liparis tanakae]|uniref:Uncharacterized protein n=1 Tax=Liparis tanakae TaxID=230148 RepID=A0A4Z2EF24_9TELE|nr:hypothetical protein EYF80_062763 [Liparis tanakae]